MVKDIDFRLQLPSLHAITASFAEAAERTSAHYYTQSTNPKLKYTWHEYCQCHNHWQWNDFDFKRTQLSNNQSGYGERKLRI